MIICPSISLFGAIYFAIKYFIDKYNLVYVYPVSVTGEVDITVRIKNITQFNIILVELLTYTFFLNTFEAAESTAVLLSVLFFQLTSYLVLKFVNFEKGMKRFAEKGNFMSEIDEMRYEYKIGILDQADREYFEKNLLNQTGDDGKEEEKDADQNSSFDSDSESSLNSSCASHIKQSDHND